MRIDPRQHLHRSLATAFAIVAGLLLCACPASVSARVLEVTASLPMIGEWAQAVGGDAVRVHVIAPAAADPHTFEPSVRSIQAVSRSQVLFILGLGLEPWAERLAQAEPSFNIVVIAPASGLHRLDASGHDGHSDHTDDCQHGEFDPHVWLDPLRVKEMVRSIAASLGTLAPQKADLFARNADAYCGLLDALDAEIRTTLAPIATGRRILVTNHNNLHYFAERYNFVVLDTLLGVQGAAGGQPSARRVKEIVKKLREHRVTALFADASTNRKLLEAVAAEADIAHTGVVYSVPAGSGSLAPDYLQMMRHNANEIARLLF